VSAAAIAGGAKSGFAGEKGDAGGRRASWPSPDLMTGQRAKRPAMLETLRLRIDALPPPEAVTASAALNAAWRRPRTTIGPLSHKGVNQFVDQFSRGALSVTARQGSPAHRRDHPKLPLLQTSAGPKDGLSTGPSGAREAI